MGHKPGERGSFCYGERLVGRISPVRPAEPAARTGTARRSLSRRPAAGTGGGSPLLCACPGTVRGQGSIREGAFCPMPCIRGSAQELLSLAPGVWTERRRSIPEILLMAFAPYPGPCPPGHFYREMDSPARFSCRAFAPYPGPRPPGYSHREGASPARLSCR